MVQAIFDMIENEYERCYWNKNQVAPESPFRNKGAEYSNKVFSAHSYDWNYDQADGEDINFNYKDGQFCATWYKHAHRGLYFWSNTGKKINAEFLNKMLKNCLKSIWRDFDVREPD